MIYRLSVVLIGVMTIAFACVITLTRADDTVKSNDMPFKGAVLTVYARGRDLETAPTIREPQIIEIGKRPFLVGVCISAAPDSDWLHGLKVAFSLDAIDSIVAYDSSDEFLNRMKDLP